MCQSRRWRRRTGPLRSEGNEAGRTCRHGLARVKRSEIGSGEKGYSWPLAASAPSGEIDVPSEGNERRARRTTLAKGFERRATSHCLRCRQCVLMEGIENAGREIHVWDPSLRQLPFLGTNP